jgi:hypothetical protein
MRNFLSSMLVSGAVLLIALGLVSSAVGNDRAAVTGGIRAFCERNNITDTQTHECMIKIRLMKQQKERSDRPP